MSAKLGCFEFDADDPRLKVNGGTIELTPDPREGLNVGPGLAQAGDPPGPRVCFLCRAVIDPHGKRERGTRVLGSGYAHTRCWEKEQAKRADGPGVA